MKLFDVFKKKDKKTLDVKEYKKNSEAVKKTQYRSITIDPGSATRPEEYYNSRSYAFGYAKTVVTVMLIGLIILAFTVFSDIFSAENFRYLIKHINFNTSGAIDEFADVVYPDIENSAFGDFRQDFVIASPGVLKLYDYNGGLSLNSMPSTQNPKLSISKAYILMYDEGDLDFYVYNNFSNLFSASLDKPIIMADMSDSGRFAIVTESSAYAARISVYDENFTAIRWINRNNPVTGIKLSSNGEYLAVTTVKLDGADCISTLTVFDLGNETKAVFTENIYNEIPASVEFESEGADSLSVCVVTDKAIRRYSMLGEEESILIQGNDPLFFDINSEYTAYTVKNSVIDNSSTLYCVSNKDMKVSFEKEFDEKIIDMKVRGENVYVLTGTKIIKINSNGKTVSRDLEDNPHGMVVFSSEEVFIRYSNIFKLVAFE